MNHVGAQRRAAESMRAVRVVVEFDLQRDQPVFPEVLRLDRYAFLEIPEMQAAAVLQVAHLLQVEARHEGVRRGPLGGHHHVVARLVPEVIAEGDVAHGVFPPPDDLEVLVEVEITPRRLALRITQERNDDLGSQAMHRVRAGQVRSGLDLGPFNHLVQARRTRVGGGVDDMDVVRPHPRHQQIFARHRGIVMTGRTGVPAHVVQLVPDPGHLEPVDHPGIGRAVRIRVHRRQVVRHLNTRPGVDRDGIKQLFPRRLYCLCRTCIARSTARSVHHLRLSLDLFAADIYRN